MAISYKKLWKMLIDKDLRKTDLPELAKISMSTVTKMGHNENVSTEILGKICKALDCKVEDIMEFIDESQD